MYRYFTPANSGVEIDVSVSKADSRPLKRLFYVRNIMATLYGRVVWGAERLTGPYSGTSTHTFPPTRLTSGKRVLNRLVRSMTMNKSQSASAQTAKSHNEEFRAGAFAGFSALQTIDRIVDHYRNGEVDSKSYFRDRELIKTVMVNHIGPATPFIHGFVTALAEYIDVFMQENDGPVLTCWKPESVMTASEVKAERARIFEGEEAMDRIVSLQGETA
jgi:hypothetical protein